MFTNKAQFDALKSAFLKTMDNDRGNDFAAHQQISMLASTMTDAEINAAYAQARNHANHKNSKKNGIGDTKDPYKNVNSASAHQAQFTGLQANNWMHMFPLVPPSLWGVLHGCGCGCY